jgi:hypothetical protein
MAKEKEELEEIRLIAECLVYVMKSVNQYPLHRYQDAAEGKGDLTKVAVELRTKLIEYYFTLDPDKWKKIADESNPKGKKLAVWIASNFIFNPPGEKYD